MRIFLLGCCFWGCALLTQESIPQVVRALWLLGNLGVFCIYASDKLWAKLGTRRVPNSILKGLGAVAPLGASSAMLLLRHKTKRLEFLVAIVIGLCLASLIVNS